MSYRFPATHIHEIVQAPKRLIDGQSVEPEKRGKQGLRFHAFIERMDGNYLDLRFLGTAGVSKEPTTYEGTLLLDQERIRGVGHAAVARRNFRAKLRIPAGWHQNVCDPGKPTSSPEYNRHEPLPDFLPSDFTDFTRKVANLWSIDLGQEGGLL